MSLSKPRVVVYDFDGVVVDSLPYHHQAINTVLARCGQTAPPLRDICQWWSSPVNERFRQLGATQSPEEIWEIYNQAFGTGIPPLWPGYQDVIQSLHRSGIPVYVLTVAPRERVCRILGHYDLFRYLEDVVCDQEDKSESLLKIIEHQEVKPLEVMMVGDMRSDITCACSAGVRAIGFDGGYGGYCTLISAGAEMVISAHVEILSLASIGAD